MKRRCLETRKLETGMTFRRYLEIDGRTTTTIELPEQVLRGAAPAAKLADRMARWYRKQAAESRRLLVKLMLEKGEKPVAIAHELGMTTSAVERIRRGERGRDLNRALARRKSLDTALGRIG